ncbi:MAG TPA: FCD domain-containing protein [Anaerolineales bacterium]|nr:FCD domain-containing protein [Anaerolineales bacterium]
MANRHLSIEVSEFLKYLASHTEAEGGLPALTELSGELGISVATLREQLEVARALDLVEIRPRTGMRRKPFAFASTVRQSLGYALLLDDNHFQKYSELRNHIESAYWDEAVRKLAKEDKKELKSLILRAREKLLGSPVQVPHEEHRALHMLIYSRLNNPFVTGILEAYWDAYESVGLNMYAGSINYLHKVWDYHNQMVVSICNGNYSAGREALIAHVDLLSQRPSSSKGDK